MPFNRFDPCRLLAHSDIKRLPLYGKADLANLPAHGLVSRDDFALAAMDRGIGGRPAGLPPHQDRRPAPFDGAAAPPSRGGLTHTETADPAERFAERAIVVGDQQRDAEHA